MALLAYMTGVALVGIAPSMAHAAVPGAPTRLLAIASNASVRLGWFGPDDDGGSAPTSFHVTASTGQSFVVTNDPAILPLPNGVTVTFRVAAVNVDGEGAASVASNAVTPTAPSSTNTWASTGSMVQSRVDAGAVRLANGKVLVVGGFPIGFDEAPRLTAELYDPAASTWSLTGSMDLPRSGFSTTLLPDGRVLVAGGLTPSYSVRASARIYTPSTGLWTSTGALLLPMAGHTATLLSSGRVLVAGGVTTGVTTGLVATARAQLYNPATGTWSFTGSLHTARVGHRATLRTDGRVLVAGGSAGSAGFRSAEVYNPTSGTWGTTSSMTTVRENDEICCHEQVLMPSGKVLVAGGYGADVLKSAEVYNPVVGTWVGTAGMKVAREGGFGFVRLANGKALATGGLDNFGALRYAELYDQTTGTWTRTNDMTSARYGAVTVLLTSGKVLVAGGPAMRSAELLTPG